MTDLILTASIALVSALVMFVFGYRASGKARERGQADKRLEDTKRAQEVRDEVGLLDDTGLAARASKWLRHDNG